MDIKKLNPWNWFKHEEKLDKKETVPITRSEAIQTQHPIADIMRLHREMDHLFDDAFRRFPSLSRPAFENHRINHDFLSTFRANVNVASDDKHYTITLEAPGMEQQDLSIELKDRTLFIQGNKQQEKEEQDKHYYRVERHYGSFERVLAIPDDADADEINATMKNGVLTVRIPRKEQPKPEIKQIEIGSE